MAKALVWKGDIRHCDYCRDAIFPHTHAPEEENAPQASRKARKAAPRKAKTDSVVALTVGRRGRPMKAENWSLIRTCTCA